MDRPLSPTLSPLVPRGAREKPSCKSVPISMAVTRYPGAAPPQFPTRKGLNQAWIASWANDEALGYARSPSGTGQRDGTVLTILFPIHATLFHAQQRIADKENAFITTPGDGGMKKKERRGAAKQQGEAIIGISFGSIRLETILIWNSGTQDPPPLTQGS